jgi:molybdopterin molybdotransferase
LPGGVESYATVSEVLDALSSASGPETESVPSASAFGRISAEDVTAPQDIPPLPTAHMDGFAVAAGGVGDGTSTLRIAGRAGPGERPARALRRGEAFGVSTGAYLPAGADTVVPIEQAVARGGVVKVAGPLEKGAFVFGAGEDVHRGSLVLRRGSAVRAQDVGMLVSLGVARLKVFSRPVVAILATGDEIAGGRVRNSHTPVFAGICEALGALALDAGTVADDRRAIAAKLRRALSKAGLVLTTGGTSVGGRDLVGEAVQALRPDRYFHGIRMDRGRVSGVALVRGKAIVMLPGPVQGAMNAFALFALPTIDRLTGRAGAATVSATMASAWTARKKFPDFVKVVYVALKPGEGGLMAEPLTAETESMALLSKANGLVVVPEDVTALGAGTAVAVRMIPGFSSA